MVTRILPATLSSGTGKEPGQYDNEECCDTAELNAAITHVLSAALAWRKANRKYQGPSVLYRATKELNKAVDEYHDAL